MAKARVKVPATAQKGEVIQIKTLIPHKMETGRRKHKKTKKLIPQHIINKFVCKFEGKDVFSADLHAAVAANPYMAFYTRVEKSGTFNFTWTDDKGKTVKASKKIKVS
ncbi:MAG: thiosulfate oxidation carrier complex protein SoxZ [Alphaproteobacteria bacterium]|jgi:sulfur-oxidizing protein SoxZ|tara:strand:+ start:168 stop:491 length:324 start_codon:yes stop_codon:yes gene_type:complete